MTESTYAYMFPLCETYHLQYIDAHDSDYTLRNVEETVFEKSESSLDVLILVTT